MIQIYLPINLQKGEVYSLTNVSIGEPDVQAVVRKLTLKVNYENPMECLLSILGYYLQSLICRLPISDLLI